MNKNDWAELLKDYANDDLDHLVEIISKTNEMSADIGPKIADTLKVVRQALKKYFPKQFDFSVIKRTVTVQEIIIEMEMVDVPKGFDTNSEIGKFNVMNMSKVFNEVYKYIGLDEQYRIEYTINETKPIVMVKMTLE